MKVSKIKSKINKAFCVDGKVEGNGLLAIMKYIIFKHLEKHRKHFVIDRPEKYGGKVEFKNYEELEEAFASVTEGPEGAGLGIICVILCLRRLGFEGDVFEFLTGDETVASIRLPL